MIITPICFGLIRLIRPQKLDLVLHEEHATFLPVSQLALSPNRQAHQSHIPTSSTVLSTPLSRQHKWGSSIKYTRSRGPLELGCWPRRTFTDSSSFFSLWMYILRQMWGKNWSSTSRRFEKARWIGDLNFLLSLIPVLFFLSLPWLVMGLLESGCKYDPKANQELTRL
jgi:hypothetical protein